MGYSRKKKLGKGADEKNPIISRFLTFPLEVPDKTELDSWKFQNILLNSLQIPDDIFLITPGNFTSFLINL